MIVRFYRRSYHGGNPRVDHRGKGKFNNSQDADGWQRRPLSNDSSSAVRASNNEPKRNILAHSPNIVGEASENSIMDPVGKTEGDSAEVSDSADIQAQVDSVDFLLLLFCTALFCCFSVTLFFCIKISVPR